MVQYNIKSIKQKIIRELHEGEKSVAELSDVISVDKANLYSKRAVICYGLSELTNHGFINERYIILKKAKDNEPGKAGKRYWLSESGKEVYNLFMDK